MNNKKKHIFVWLLISTAIASGCKPENPGPADTSTSMLADGGAAKGGQSNPNALTHVGAVGRLEPAGGVVPIVAKPGDRITEITVKIGENYETGTEVAKLAGNALLDLEVQVAEAQLQEAIAQRDAELDAADAKLAVVDQAIAANQLKLDEARQRLDSARSTGGEFDLLESKISLAEDALQKLQQAATPGPAGRSLATQSQLKQQELAVKAAQYELLSAQREAEDAVKVAEMLLVSSKKERAAAEAAKLAAAAGVPLNSSHQKIALLKEQIKASKPTMPISGFVLSIDATAGQPTSTMPIMQVADLDRMICRAEVPVEDRHLISAGDRAVLRGGGLPTEITGEVKEISLLVGSPKMTSLNPMDPVDYRMAPVIIEIDPQHLAVARQFVNTQVKVVIAVDQRRPGTSKSNGSSKSM